MTRSLTNGRDKDKLARSHEPPRRRHIFPRWSDDVGSGKRKLKKTKAFSAGTSGVWKNDQCSL